MHLARPLSAFSVLLLLGGCPDSKPSPTKATANTTASRPAAAAAAPAGGEAPAASPAAGGAPAAAAATAPAAGAPAAPARPLPEPREGGPSREACERAADHLGAFVAESMVPKGAGAADRAYVDRLVAEERPNVVRFCLETATKEEIDCVIAAQDFPALAACERFRRQVPADLAKRNEVNESDCDKVFQRLRQFKIEEGVSAAEIDATRDQVIRACLEKAKPGTVACFIASRSYEEARRCP